MKENLSDLRKTLDTIDDDILNLLAKRFKTVFLIGKYKKENKTPIFDEKRTEFIINKAKTVADKNNINSEYFETIYKTIVYASCDFQNKIIFNTEK